MSTFITSNRQEALNITLMSEKQINKMTQWRVLDEHSFSDHCYIECIIEENAGRVKNFRNHRKKNWQVHLPELKRGIPMILPFQPENKENLNIPVDQFTVSCRQV